MTTRTPCPRCGFLLTPHRRSRHMAFCRNMPLLEEMAELAKTMTMAEIAREIGAKPSNVTDRLRFLGIKAKKYRRVPLLTDEQRDQIVKLYNENVTILKISTTVGVSEGTIYAEARLLSAAGRLKRRNRKQHIRLNIPRCSVCKIWLDGRDVPKGDGGRCGFCCGADPSLEVVAPTAMVLYVEVVDRALKDSRSKNGHRAAAREWFASEGAEFWLDAVSVNSAAAREQIEREAVT